MKLSHREQEVVWLSQTIRDGCVQPTPSVLVAAHTKQKVRQFKLYILQQEHNRGKKPSSDIG